MIKQNDGSRVRVYFDTEFTGLHQYTRLISIGCISEVGDEFYAEVPRRDFENGFAEREDEEFFLEELEPNLRLQRDELNKLNVIGEKPMAWQLLGEVEKIAKELEGWLGAVARFTKGGLRKVELWSDLYAYDWVLFCGLWGHALGIPECTYYIPMDLSTYLRVYGYDPDVSREEFARYSPITSETPKHNALHDARMIKACVDRLDREGPLRT
jgi:hypothetical protein